MVFMLLLATATVNAQTVINYQTWTGASGCNIFSSQKNVPATINGTAGTIAHLTAIGQPSYDNTNKSVNVDCNIYNGSLPYGTEYRTTVNFKQGYAYKITINAARIMLTPQGGNAQLRLDLNNGGSGNNTLCNGTQSIDPNFSGNLKNSQQIGSNTFSDYIYNYAPLSAPQAYMMIAAVPPAGSVYQTILIRKITIEETPPAASFSIASSVSTLACGATTPVTFTVNNNAGTTGITGYTWNIGTVPNGWIYSGNPAPATITTGAGVNTLTLTPDCGKTLKSVSATVAANGNNYNTTNAAGVSLTQPTYSITGNSSLCSGQTNYTLNGAVCGSSIAWTAPPSNLGTLSSLTTPTTTLTYGGTSGNISLTANVTSCGVTSPVTLPVRVGAYTSSDYTMSYSTSQGSGTSQPLYWCPNQSFSLSISGAGGSNYVWNIPTGFTIITQGSNYIVLRAPTTGYPPTTTFSVTFNEPCGTIITKSMFAVYSSPICSAGSNPYTITPNPASSYITIACASLQTYCNIAAVQITDLYGNVKSSQSWPYTNQQVQMPVYFLTSGTYIAKIYSGTQWYSVQFVKQ